MLNINRFLVSLSLISVFMTGVVHATDELGGASETTTTSVAETGAVSAASVVPSHKSLAFTKKPKATDKFWDKLAYCETHGDWKNGGNWAGGLGIAQSTWYGFGGREFARSPHLATREEQIVVAHRISTQGYKTVRYRDPERAKTQGVPVSYVWEKHPVGFGGWGALPCAGGKPTLFHYNPKEILTVQYKFNQRGMIVKDLQNFLRIKADGHYGLDTRAKHVSYLRKQGLSTAGVGVLPSFLTGSVPSDKTKRCPSWEGRLRYYGLQPVDRFSYIMWRESRCKEKIVSGLNSNGTRDYGLLQVNSSWRTVTAQVCGSKLGNMKVLLNHKCNLKVAKYLLDNGGLGHWSASSGKE